MITGSGNTSTDPVGIPNFTMVKKQPIQIPKDVWAYILEYADDSEITHKLLENRLRYIQYLENTIQRLRQDMGRAAIHLNTSLNENIFDVDV